MTEKQISDDIIKKANRLSDDSFAMKYYGSAMTRKGVPDIVGSLWGTPFWVETKLPEEREAGLSLAQKSWLQKLQRCGFVTGVVCSMEDLIDLVVDREVPLCYHQ